MYVCAYVQVSLHVTTGHQSGFLTDSVVGVRWEHATHSPPCPPGLSSDWGACPVRRFPCYECQAPLNLSSTFWLGGTGRGTKIRGVKFRPLWPPHLWSRGQDSGAPSCGWRTDSLHPFACSRSYADGGIWGRGGGGGGGGGEEEREVWKSKEIVLSTIVPGLDSLNGADLISRINPPPKLTLASLLC